LNIKRTSLLIARLVLEGCWLPILETEFEAELNKASLSCTADYTERGCAKRSAWRPIVDVIERIGYVGPNL
jgi:hypothetical protein